MIIFVTGRRDAGKTELARALFEELSAAGIKTGGICSPAEFYRGRKCRYFAQNLKTGNKKFLLSVAGGPKTDRAGFRFANAVLARCAACKAVIIDEMGPLELLGRGFFRQAEKLARRRNAALLITVRPGMAGAMAAKLKVKYYHACDISGNKRLVRYRAGKHHLRPG
ncbi:MAG: nucleoside-triphosphatase [Elusimicrobiales bacterium]